MRRGLSYSNVVATLALFLAIGGGVVFAAGKIGGEAKVKRKVSVTPISLTLNERPGAPAVSLIAARGSKAYFFCEDGLPQLGFTAGPADEAVLSVAVYKSGVSPVIHTVTGPGVDPLPHNSAGADIVLTLRRATGVVSEARLTFQYRPDGFGANHDCWLQGTVSRFK
jgi:hypothetical protein